MKVQDLFEAKRAATDKGYFTPGYDNKRKIPTGSIADWLARMGAEKEDVAKAFEAAKNLPSYDKLTKSGASNGFGMVDRTTAGEMKNGTFSFTKAGGDKNERYMVYANGLIRSQGPSGWRSSGDSVAMNAPTRLKSPKPRLVAGDVHKSLIKIYDAAFKELVSKSEKRGPKGSPT